MPKGQPKSAQITSTIQSPREFVKNKFSDKPRPGGGISRLLMRLWLTGERAALLFVTVCESLGLDADAGRAAYFSPEKRGQDPVRTAKAHEQASERTQLIEV